MLLQTQVEFARKVRSANADLASATWPALVSLPVSPFIYAGKINDTVNNATGAQTAGQLSGGLLWTGGPNDLCPNMAIPNNIRVKPYMLGSDGNTMLMQGIGWDVTDWGKSTEIWTPTLLWEVLCTGCTLTGLASKSILNTERFCDTIAPVTNKGTQGTNIDVMSPQDDTPGYLVFDARGFPMIEIRFNRNGSVSTSCNALWARL